MKISSMISSVIKQFQKSPQEGINYHQFFFYESDLISTQIPDCLSDFNTKRPLISIKMHTNSKTNI